MGERKRLGLNKECHKKIGMATAVALTLFAGMLLFCRHWRFELPLYPNVDEQLSLGCIFELLNQHLYAGDLYVLDFFRYPHLTFYYAAIGARILGKIFRSTDTVILLRYVVCGTALLSNICIYFSAKILTGSRKWAYLGFLLSVFSLYGYAYLFYTGPDTLLYAVANGILLLGCLILREKDEERAVYLWYPLLAVSIGLAMAAKYHGVVFGVFWLCLHIIKKYWKRHRNNYLFFLDCIVLAITFVLCNYSLFFHFKTFVGDNLYNLNHYAWGHPGIEHNLSILGYSEALVFSSYGLCGGLLLLFGAVYLIRRKEWGTFVSLALMPLGIVILLSKYSIVLGRNLSLVLPFAFLFMTYGLMETERLFGRCLRRFWAAGENEVLDGRAKQRGGLKKCKIGGYMAFVLAAVLVFCNSVTVLANYRYDLSYDHAAAFIEEKIPAGATIYCTDYPPMTEEGRYEMIDIGEDLALLPDQLSENEYFIDVEYATGYFSQKKDYLFLKGGYMYPEKKALYEKKTAAYSLVEKWQGLSYGGEWKYRIGYLDLFLRSPGEYYVGPTIAIYKNTVI